MAGIDKFPILAYDMFVVPMHHSTTNNRRYRVEEGRFIYNPTSRGEGTVVTHKCWSVCWGRCSLHLMHVLPTDSACNEKTCDRRMNYKVSTRCDLEWLHISECPKLGEWCSLVEHSRVLTLMESTHKRQTPLLIVAALLHVI